MKTIETLINETAVAHFQESVRRVDICLAQLNEEQVWHDANKNLVSIGNLLLHLCGNITQYVLSGIGGQPDARQRDLEFTHKPDLDNATLFQQFKTVCDNACGVVASLSKERLEEQVRIQGFDHKVCSALIHVLEHLSYHVGQISFMCKLANDKDLGYYAGHDLNKTNE